MLPASNQPRSTLQPPRFRLRTLLVVVALCCLLLVVLNALDPYGKFATIMLVLTVAAHFIGANLGHRLRDLGSQPSHSEPAKSAAERYPRVEPQQFAPTTRLSHRRGPGRLIVIMTVSWALIGAGGGAALLYLVNGERSNLFNVASGAAAFAVLGAIWGFALASFLQEILIAIFEAQKVK